MNVDSVDDVSVLLDAKVVRLEKLVPTIKGWAGRNVLKSLCVQDGYTNLCNCETIHLIGLDIQADESDILFHLVGHTALRVPL